jgi:hypothetical protein
MDRKSHRSWVRIPEGSPYRGKIRTSLKLSVLATLRSFYRGARQSYEFKLSDTREATSPFLILKETAKPVRQQRNPVILAEEWQQRIVAGEVRSRADLARKLGVSRARVTQMLGLLSLTQDAKDKVRALGDPLMSRSVSEKALRRLASFAVDEQKDAVRLLLGNA